MATDYSVRRPHSARANTIEIESKYLGEPSLLFCGGRAGPSQVRGISAFGPHSLDLPRHPVQLRVGFIGTGQTISSARSWLESCAKGVPGEADLADFPGFDDDRGFYTKLCFDKSIEQTLTVHELGDIKKHRLRKDQFQHFVDLVGEKVRLLSQSDNAPSCVMLALPDQLIETLATVDFTDGKRGHIHRDLRLALKAQIMRHKLASQILLQRMTEAKPDSTHVDHKARCAWNFFTSLYFKAGGIPWAPSGLREGTCHVGISFYRPLGDDSGRIRTSVAQAFDEHGDGIVLRGQDFAWDDKRHEKSPHLDRDSAFALVDMVLRRYTAEMKQAPARVVIHKTSRFWDEEREGFQEALRTVREFDLLAVTPSDEVRLVRAGQYPPLRGTRFRVGEVTFLYTTGFISALNAYPHGHVPSPLQVADHFGDSDIDQLLWDILVLSKMNWNSAGFAGVMPITVGFARRVGDIMKEIEGSREPEPQFRYYV